jgi:hypothetical protein
MTDQDFARLAYREGNKARIREALLASIKAGEWVGGAHDALVAQIRGKLADRTKTETDWLRRHNAAAFQRGLQ